MVPVALLPHQVIREVSSPLLPGPESSKGTNRNSAQIRMEEYPMKRVIEIAIAASVVLLVGGCATKKYVAKQTDPIAAKVSEVEKQAQNTQKQLEGDEPKISAAAEKADSADARAGDALGRADAASKKTDQVKSDLTNQFHSELNERIANIDDYKPAGDVTVLFKFNSAKLTDDAKQQLDQLRMRNLALTEDARQGQRLQALLAFKQQYVGSTVTAQVIGTSGSDQSHVLFLDKGANDGLKPDMAVITPDGIVGKLRDVDATTSQLLLINDASSGAGVILETTRTRGVLRGTAAGILQIGTLLPDDRIKAGEHVLTSGGDRVFPRGLSVGNVESIALDPEHPPFTAIRIHPSANLARLEEVLIVTNVASQIANSKDLADDGTQNPDAAGDHLPGLKDLSAKPDPNQPPLPPNTPAPLPHPKPIIHPDRYTPGTVPPAGSLTPGGSNGNGTITSSPSKPKPQSNPENNEER